MELISVSDQELREIEKNNQAKEGNWSCYNGRELESTYYKGSCLSYKDVPLMLQCSMCNAHFFIKATCPKCSEIRSMRFAPAQYGSGGTLPYLFHCSSCGYTSLSSWSCTACNHMNDFFTPLGTANRRTIYYLSKGGCFIATACYGSYDAPEVIALRDFRDRMLKTIIGKAFVKVYYYFSPPVADFISNKNVLKNAIRKFVIDPIFRSIQDRK